MKRELFPGLDESAPEMSPQGALEPGSNAGRRRKKWRADNARRAGQRRAVEMLDVKPKQISMPEPLDVKHTNS